MISDDFTIEIDKGHFVFFNEQKKGGFWNRGFGLRKFHAL
jgi:hypothetical protein